MIAWFADLQDGVVASWQLAAWAVPDHLVRTRLRARRLRRIHHGVFAAGHAALTSRGHALAAVLAGGRGAVLSHHSAGALHGIRPHNGTRHHISVPRSRRARTTAKLQVHRPRTLEDTTTIEGIPVTTLARTLRDLADVVPANQVRRALVRAEQLRTLDVHAIREVIAASPDRRGARGLRTALERHHPLFARTESELELAFVQLVLDRGLPEPEVNVPFGPYRVDFLWRAQRVVVETDGGTHRTPSQQQEDAARDRLVTRTHGLLRFTWWDVEGTPDATIADLRDRLGLDVA